MPVIDVYFLLISSIHTLELWQQHFSLVRSHSSVYHTHNVLPAHGYSVSGSDSLLGMSGSWRPAWTAHKVEDFISYEIY